jgi:hypothetical protein
MQVDLDAFYSIANERLAEVLLRNRKDTPEALGLIFETRTLLISANEDDDTISVAADETLKADECTDLSSSGLWRSLLGQSFGWGWVTTNQQGYQDGVLLSFGGITPQVMLEVVASSIKMHRITEAEPIGEHMKS